jgi:hypothetical protein
MGVPSSFRRNYAVTSRGEEENFFSREKRFFLSPQCHLPLFRKKGLFPGDAGFAGEFAGFEAGGKDINHVVKDKLSVGLIAGDGVFKKGDFKFFGQHFNIPIPL